MSTLKTHEKVIFDRIFDRGGYVLDFSDKTFSEFFREHGISIDAQKYQFNGPSKMKRLRAFWEIEPDMIVGKVFEALMQYAEAIGKVDPDDKRKAATIIDRLLGRQTVQEKVVQSEDEFLKRDFQKIDWGRLNTETDLQYVLEQRIKEIKIALQHNAPLSVVFLCGSTLEGLLLDIASRNIQMFNLAESAPKTKDGKCKQLYEWTLNDFINVSHEVGLLSLDVKKHSHALRDFRNYIHPRQQIVEKFNPDQHTAKISWQVLQAAIADLCKQR
ncbi:MAG: hypothetical protein PHV55_05320 [Candidatus Omnitrophica bacterium]|nr:hypothetical protein [Candidatus Omnitrophota bacterium]